MTTLVRVHVETAAEIEAAGHEKIAEGHELLARARRLAATSDISAIWLSLPAAAKIAGGIETRVLTDEGRKGRLKIEHAGARPVVSRAELERWITTPRATAPKPTNAMTPKEAARAAVAARRSA